MKNQKLKNALHQISMGKTHEVDPNFLRWLILQDYVAYGNLSYRLTDIGILRLRQLQIDTGSFGISLGDMLKAKGKLSL